MAQSVLEMAKELVMAQIETRRLIPEDMQKELQKTYASLMALKQREEAGSSSSVSERVAAPKPVDWRKSITKHAITCLECNATLKQLSIRHLKDHRLDARSYRAKYGIPRTQSLEAKATTARRKEIVQHTRPWEKTPRYVQAHGGESGGKTTGTTRRAKSKNDSRKTAPSR
jgi:predicted transcriptional regulator